MNKRGISSQIFIWIFAMVVLGVIIYFGFDMIGKTWCFGKKVDTVKFHQDLKMKVEEIYLLSKGSNAKAEFSVPNGIREVCFCDNCNFNNNRKDDYVAKNSDIKNTIETIPDAGNIFFSSDDDCVDASPIRIKEIMFELNPLWFDTSRGKLNIVLENIGDKVRVQPLSPR